MLCKQHSHLVERRTLHCVRERVHVRDDEEGGSPAVGACADEASQQQLQFLEAGGMRAEENFPRLWEASLWERGAQTDLSGGAQIVGPPRQCAHKSQKEQERGGGWYLVSRGGDCGIE